MPGNNKKKKKASKRQRQRGSATAPGAELRRREVAAERAAKVAGAPRAASLRAAVTAPVAAASGGGGRAVMHSSLQLLQMKYSALGKAEWWWIFDDSLAAIARLLKRDAFVVLDQFLIPDQARRLRAEIRAQYDAGRMAAGVLGGGKSGKSTAYVLKQVRGDHVGWFTGKEEGHGWDVMPNYRVRVNTLVTELKDHVPELNVIQSSSTVMCTCYPGAGARYTMHVDNARGNGRKLTALCYLNMEWQPGDGGELRVYRPDRKTVVTDVAPLGGRVLLFFSDLRVPHEVLPAKTARYAATIWYFNDDERKRALAEAEQQAAADKAKEEERIRKEIAKFEGEFGASAQAFSDPEQAKDAAVAAPPDPTLDGALRDLNGRAGRLIGNVPNAGCGPVSIVASAAPAPAPKPLEIHDDEPGARSGAPPMGVLPATAEAPAPLSGAPPAAPARGVSAALPTGAGSGAGDGGGGAAVIAPLPQPPALERDEAGSTAPGAVSPTPQIGPQLPPSADDRHAAVMRPSLPPEIGPALPPTAPGGAPPEVGPRRAPEGGPQPPSSSRGSENTASVDVGAPVGTGELHFAAGAFADSDDSVDSDDVDSDD